MKNNKKILIAIFLIAVLMIIWRRSGSDPSWTDSPATESSSETVEASELSEETESAESESESLEESRTVEVTDGPAIDCSSDMSIENKSIEALGYEAVRLQLPAALKITDSELSGSMRDEGSGSWNVAVYGKGSGDAEKSKGSLFMKGVRLVTDKGGMFFVSNADALIYLSNVETGYVKEKEYFLKCTGNSPDTGWGEAGKNGARCSFTADEQLMDGDIIYDSISDLDLYIKNGSYLWGAVLEDESRAGEGGGGHCNLYIDKISAWTVTADCRLDSLCSEGRIVDESGRKVSIVGRDGETFAEGDSDYSISVSSYSETADMSGSALPEDFED